MTQRRVLGGLRENTIGVVHHHVLNSYNYICLYHQGMHEPLLSICIKVNHLHNLWSSAHHRKLQVCILAWHLLQDHNKVCTIICM